MNKKTKYERFDKEKWQKINKERNKVFGHRIMMRRKQIGLNQSELAELTGISDNQISNIENGRSFPKFSNFLILCDVLDCNADYLLSGIVKTDTPDQIIEMVSTMEPQELKALWVLVDAFTHRNDAVTIDI